jgi:hypothetical protein
VIDRVVNERKTAQQRAEQPATLFEHEGDRKSEEYQVSDTKSISQSADADYLTARIAHDRPDILEKDAI